MADFAELEHRLVVLRGELAFMLKDGCTPTQFLKLQRDLIRAWAELEEHRRRHFPARRSGAAGATAAEGRDEIPQGVN
jgi:hypothetical protein